MKLNIKHIAILGYEARNSKYDIVVSKFDEYEQTFGLTGERELQQCSTTRKWLFQPETRPNLYENYQISAHFWTPKSP